MIQLTGVLRVLDSTKRQEAYQAYRMPAKKEEFNDCLKATAENKREGISLQTVASCKEEIQTLWKSLSGECKKLHLSVHPNVYVDMSEDNAYAMRIRNRLADCFKETSMMQPVIELARLDAAEVKICIAYNGDVSYSSNAVA